MNAITTQYGKFTFNQMEKTATMHGCNWSKFEMFVDGKKVGEIYKTEIVGRGVTVRTTWHGVNSNRKNQGFEYDCSTKKEAVEKIYNAYARTEISNRYQ